MIWNALSIFVHEISNNAESPLPKNIWYKCFNHMKYNRYSDFLLKSHTQNQSFLASEQIFSSNFCIRNYGVRHQVD